MFGFGRKKRQDKDTAETFVEATGGGWSDVPETVPDYGGSSVDYVMNVLVAAREEAQAVPVGDYFDFTLTDIPRGITSPHEIVFGLMAQSVNYGLQIDYTHNETVRFRRVA